MKKNFLFILTMIVSLFPMIQGNIHQEVRKLVVWSIAGASAWTLFKMVKAPFYGEFIPFITFKLDDNILRSVRDGACASLGGFGVYMSRNYVREYTPLGLGNYVTLPILAVCCSYLSSWGLYELQRWVSSTPVDTTVDEDDKEDNELKHTQIAFRGLWCAMAGLLIIEGPAAIEYFKSLVALAHYYIYKSNH